MRGDHIDALGYGKAGIVGKDDEGGNAARAGRLAGAGKDGVDVGDTAIGNPGLFAVENVSVALGAGGAGHGRDIRAGFLFRQREGGEPLPARHLEQHGVLQFRRAGEADGAGAQSLHGEGEIGEAVMPGERFASKADAAGIDGAAAGIPGRCGQQAGFPEQRNQLAAGGIRIGMIDRGEHAGTGEGIEPLHEIAMLRPEEGPVEMLARRAGQGKGKRGGRGHGLNCPRRRVCAWRRRPRKRGGNPASPCRSPAPVPRIRPFRRCPSPIPG